MIWVLMRANPDNGSSNFLKTMFQETIKELRMHPQLKKFPNF